VRWTLKNQ